MVATPSAYGGPWCVTTSPSIARSRSLLLVGASVSFRCVYDTPNTGNLAANKTVNLERPLVVQTSCETAKNPSTKKCRKNAANLARHTPFASFLARNKVKTASDAAPSPKPNETGLDSHLCVAPSTAFGFRRVVSRGVYSPCGWGAFCVLRRRGAVDRGLELHKMRLCDARLIAKRALMYICHVFAQNLARGEGASRNLARRVDRGMDGCFHWHCGVAEAGVTEGGPHVLWE